MLQRCVLVCTTRWGLRERSFDFLMRTVYAVCCWGLPRFDARSPARSASHESSQIHGSSPGSEILFEQSPLPVQFYTQREIFNLELQLYSDPTLQQLMPARHEVLPNEDGAIRSPSGLRFPPCIVLERGESLDEFARNVDYAFITVMQARGRVCWIIYVCVLLMGLLLT
jgi:hypothetical protein